MKETTDARTAKPRALIVSVYGAYGRELGGWVSVADLISLMAELDVDEPAVRSSISRLKRRGVLVADKRGGAAGYVLSESAQSMMAEGDRRIFGRRAAQLADGWVLAVFSVPESERAKRHMLRSRLTWLGFGHVSPGVWVAPAQLHDEARDTLERLGLTAYVELFRGDHLGFTDLRTAIASWWDLASLQEMYDYFLEAYGPVAQTGSANGVAMDEGAAFASYVRVLTDWRRMPYLDPGLPAELLPDDWHGTRAADLYVRLESLLREPGLRHVRAVTAR